jgi:endonuclease/exonuclease/phosphatase family metal-dependent hydrolase
LVAANFRDAWVDSKTKEVGLSFPADKPVKRIDHVFGNTSVRARKAWTVATLASDHVPVVTEIELR